ncbi:MAG: hypothetical protein SFU25_09250 [Candidatus Caenarcaniphilales bacterium]|nr:hypothetical protein [Candidatus Caenarcaniphilales bacterium]
MISPILFPILRKSTAIQLPKVNFSRRDQPELLLAGENSIKIPRQGLAELFQHFLASWTVSYTNSDGKPVTINGDQEIGSIEINPNGINLTFQTTQGSEINTENTYEFDSPRDFLINKCCTKLEIETFLKMCEPNAKASSVAKDLGISEAALRKRLGEVYKKLEIQGNGTGKLQKAIRVINKQCKNKLTN